MVELTKAMMSFSWAQSLFGAQQLMNMLDVGAPTRQPGRAALSCNAVTRAAAAQLGGGMRGAYQVGDLLQRGAFDLTANFLTRDALNPAAVLQTTSNVLRQAWDVLQFLAAGQDLRLAWQEFTDKVQVFQWVRSVETILNIPPDGTYVPLTDLVERAYTLDPFPALWAVEGVGHYYADSFWGQGQAPHGLLTGPEAAAVPDKSMTMLHAGIGLSFAQNLLENVAPRSPGPEIETVLRRFLTLCHENSRPGYVGAALESLGLVARVFHPQELVPVLDGHLARLDREAQAYFWHGVGRAIYFSPTYFLPFGRSPWRALEMCRGEAPHELGRLNAMAGLAWAATLVNMREPQVLRVIVNCYGASFVSDGAFSNGITSAVMVREDVTPKEPFVTAFCEYRPDGSDPPSAVFWDCLVRVPCSRALGEDYRRLKVNYSLGEVFRFRDRLKVFCDAGSQ